jgi:hypothetical protein
MNTIDMRGIAAIQESSGQQREVAEQIRARYGVTFLVAEHAACYLIPGCAQFFAADPLWLCGQGLVELYPRAAEIERKWVRALSSVQWAEKQAMLRAGHRSQDANRLAALRSDIPRTDADIAVEQAVLAAVLQREPYHVPRAKAERATYYLTPGPAARNGDDPVELFRLGLAAYFPAAVSVERFTVKSWPRDAYERRVARLKAAGRRGDAERLDRHDRSPSPHFTY